MMPVFVDDLDHGQVLALPDLEVVGVVGRRDLHSAPVPNSRST